MVRLIFVLLACVVFGMATLATQVLADDPFAELRCKTPDCGNLIYGDCIQDTYKNPMFDLGVVPTWQSREQAQAAANCAAHLEQPTAEEPKAGAGDTRN